jgi:hypothetical protein
VTRAAKFEFDTYPIPGLKNPLPLNNTFCVGKDDERKREGNGRRKGMQKEG